MTKESAPKGNPHLTYMEDIHADTFYDFVDRESFPPENVEAPEDDEQLLTKMRSANSIALKVSLAVSIALVAVLGTNKGFASHDDGNPTVHTPMDGLPP